MGNQESKQITVLIGGRPYPLKIQSSDESVIRRIVRDVNEMVNKFQLNYPNRDKQDCLAMAALALAIDLDKALQAAKHDPQLPEQLEQLDQLLDQLLK
ncbi:MAG: cell division protein ZapA [Lewinellaceae bacterium]|nr:cell division protein ZapA [Lewinellaceae bacterium]